MALLQFLRDDRPLFVHPLRVGRLLLGRSDRCDIALPSEAISRVHCVVEQRAGAWWVVDRSRHGTLVNGAAIQEARLADGDTIGLGEFTFRFVSAAADLPEETATRAVRPSTHEAAIATGDGVLSIARAALVAVRGPQSGRRFPLDAPRRWLGGPAADIALGEDLPPHAALLRVVRGHVLVEPQSFPVFLDGERVREITPVEEGEELRVGAHGLRVERAVVEEPSERDRFGDLVGQSGEMQRLFGLLARVAGHDAPVLLTGESGTGKELAARAIHEEGARAGGPFVALNCAALPDAIAESELFGHEKGAFTGAVARQDGAFQRADKGTLFLDEIGEMRLELQAKLLRALECGEVRRVGGQRPEYPDVRVVAATHRNLPAMVRAGQFREDLWFRLAVLTVRMPALRDRREDIPAIARALLQRHHPGARLTAAAAEQLGRWEWPGNVRELRNVLTRAFVIGGPVIDAPTLEFHPWAFDEPAATPAPSDDDERRALTDVLGRFGGNRSRAAEALGIPRTSLLYKLRKHGLG